MNIKKQKCLRCEGKGCVDCAWSGVIFKNTEFEENKKEKHGVFDIWYCIICKKKFERNIKFDKSRPKCPKCKTVRLSYCGQVAR